MQCVWVWGHVIAEHVSSIMNVLMFRAVVLVLSIWVRYRCTTWDVTPIWVLHGHVVALYRWRRDCDSWAQWHSRVMSLARFVTMLRTFLSVIRLFCISLVLCRLVVSLYCAPILQTPHWFIWCVTKTEANKPVQSLCYKPWTLALLQVQQITPTDFRCAEHTFNNFFCRMALTRHWRMQETNLLWWISQQRGVDLASTLHLFSK